MAIATLEQHRRRTFLIHRKFYWESSDVYKQKFQWTGINLYLTNKLFLPPRWF